MNLFGLALLLAIRDVNGVERQPLRGDAGKANALFFVSGECPISNAFAREIARICADYKSKGVGCDLVYVDPAISDGEARKHAQEYGHGDYPKIVDRRHELVKATGVTVTPEAAVVNGTVRWSTAAGSTILSQYSGNRAVRLRMRTCETRSKRWSPENQLRSPKRRQWAVISPTSCLADSEGS